MHKNKIIILNYTYKEMFINRVINAGKYHEMKIATNTKRKISNLFGRLYVKNLTKIYFSCKSKLCNFFLVFGIKEKTKIKQSKRNVLNYSLF